jgi:Abnormal spindle-like microcephaly-assoc'd, ASPM-SPD-2-Hydin
MRKRSSEVSFRLRLAMYLGLLICTNSCNSGSPNPQNYSCDPNAPGQNSCEATVNFASGVGHAAGSFTPSIIGYRTSVLVANSMKPGDGRIGNFMRLTGSAQVPAFLEIGYFAIPGVALNCGANTGGLWYYVSRLDAGIQKITCLKPVPPADIGQYAALEIASVGTDPTQPTSFKVSIVTPNTTLDVCMFASCTNVLWTAGQARFATVELGQSLFGKSGAFASSAIFKNNSYERPNGVWAFQFVEGRIFSRNPPFIGVIQSPASGTSGGTYFVECCVAPTTLFPGQVDFSSVSVGQTSSQTVLISNVKSSSGNFNIANIGITGTNAADFTQTSNCGSSLAPLASCTVTIQFKPSQAGSKTATLTVTSSGGSGAGTYTSNLVGTGT